MVQALAAGPGVAGNNGSIAGLLAAPGASAGLEPSGNLKDVRTQ